MVTALRCCNVRVEKWAREFTYVARLTKGSRSESESEKARVTWVRPEAGRSSRGQDEVCRKINGGPNQ
jgi:hypothetical protein